METDMTGTVILNDMKKIYHMGLMFFVLLLLPPAAAFAQPAITFSEEIYNFGIVNGKATLEHTFEVRNAGTEDLIIIKVSPP
jgi:hypothetical protein